MQAAFGIDAEAVFLSFGGAAVATGLYFGTHRCAAARALKFSN
jgi:hypothetical protein